VRAALVWISLGSGLHVEEAVQIWFSGPGDVATRP
jgi:hypothetical protein